MATHKVPQNVEAEDKLIGPFTFKQFIFLIVATLMGATMFFLGRINLVLIIIPLPFFLVFGFLGVYRREDQPVETYLVSLIRFYLKPRRRIWDQDGLRENVIITAPKKQETNYGKDISQGEVKNRLNQLAQIMDTRGWSTKNVLVQEGQQAGIFESSDRLYTPQAAKEPTDIHDSDDVLYQYNPTYQYIDKLTEQSARAAKKEAKAHMQVAERPVKAPSYQPYPKMHQKQIDPKGKSSKKSQKQTRKKTADKPKEKSNTSTMTHEVTPDILRLSQNNDLSVSGIARQAERELQADEEVSLH